MSKGEEKIIKILQQEKIKFQREKSFSDLRKGRYRFDFYVDGARPCVIEYQGEGHYQFIPKFYHSRAEFEAAKERDRRKIRYCLANRISIYIIPYWEIDNIHTVRDLFQEKFRATTHWKNDMDWQRYQNLTNNLKI